MHKGGLELQRLLAPDCRLRLHQRPAEMSKRDPVNQLPGGVGWPDAPRHANEQGDASTSRRLR